MSKWYILKDKIPVEATLMQWAEWESIDESRKIVEKTNIGTIQVSTVFLGLDHSMSFQNPGPPVLFETMIFGGKEDSFQNKYCTWDEAVKGHKEACDIVLASLIEVDELREVVINHLN